MFFFRKIWHALFSRNTRFEIRPFALLPTNYHIVHMLNIFMLIHQLSRETTKHKNKNL